MSQSQASNAIQSLETVRDRVKQRLMKVPEYRAFLAIEKPIAEIAEISDLVAHLQAAKQKIVERLAMTQEYRALLTIEKAISDVSEIIEVVGPDAAADAAPAAVEKPAAKKEPPVIKAVPTAEAPQPAAAIGVAAPAGNAPPAATVTEMPETYTRVANELAAAIETTAETAVTNRPEKPAVHSTLGLVEEWRLTTLVRDSFSANAGDEDAPPAGEAKAEAETAKVA